MIDQKDVTIIIPHLGATREQHYSLNETLISLKETFEGKIIVAKNNKDYVGEPISVDFYDYASKIVLSEQGQCKAVNAAIATTNTPWIFVTNDDMIYAPGWFEALVKPIGKTVRLMTDSDVKISEEDLIAKPHSFIPTTNVESFKLASPILCMSPKLIEPRPGAPTFETYFCGGAGGDFDKQKWLEFAKNYHNRPETDRTIRTGFNLPFLIDRELWQLIGGYDVNYDPWGSNSDSDLEYKIKLAGVQPMQNQNSIVYHFSQTSGTFEPQNNSYWGKNFAYFEEKWGFPRTDNGIWEASFNIPTLAEGRKFLPFWENHYDR